MEYIANSNDLTSVANAIRAKGNTAAPLTFPNGFVSAIESIPSGGGGAEVLPLNVRDNGTYTAPEGKAYSPVVVNVPDSSELIYQDNEGYVVLSNHKIGKARFLDYDGTILYSFTKSDLDEMESLPANPSHAGLTAQGWNWSLANIKSYLANHPDADVNVGQMYITDDGKTRIYITLDNPEALSPYLAIAVNGEVSVDWGDGSTPDTMRGTSLTVLVTPFLQHIYPQIGDYVITIEVISGKFSFYSSSDVPSCLCNASGNTNAKRSRLYSDVITSINVGNKAIIESFGFQFCGSLKSVTIPLGIAYVATSAFRYCNALESVTIPDGITSINSSLFQYCHKLRFVSIPDGIINILSNVFQNCYLLQSITIPDSVTSIGSNAFNNCYSLSSITIPNGVTSIESNTFFSCYLLELITIPDSVTSIGDSAFQNCYSLLSITIPDGVTSIGNNAFFDCYMLKSVIIPDSVTSIGANAFQYCSTLESIIIPDGVTSIGNYTFHCCYMLKSVIIPDSVTSIGSNAFNNCYILKSIAIPDGVTSIGNYAFSGCQEMESINIPDGVTSIGNYAFQNCNSLQSVTIPDGITSIGNSMFNNCYSLQSITIPDGVTSIGSSAFNCCFCILEYHFKSLVPPSLVNTNVFSNINSAAIIYVPYSSDHSILEAYKTATNWSTYASKMQEEPAP